MDAAYDLNDLIKACGKNNHVKVLGKAQESAGSDFGLYTEQAVLYFINDGGLEKPQHISKKPWEKNPDPGLIWIDAYSFYSGPKQGYLAFFFSSKTGRWLIKSFKLNKDSEPRIYPLAEQLSTFKALMKTTEEK